MKNLIFITLLLLLSGLAHAEETRTQIPVGDSWATGPAEAPILIVEFIDFQ